MVNNVVIAIALVGLAVAVLMYFFSNGNSSLNIKSKKVGDGQHGTSRWATPKEKSKAFQIIQFAPENWRNGAIPKITDGTLIDFIPAGKQPRARVDTTDSHTMIVSAPGGGKTTFWLYPNLEYACACGMSFLATDTKGDVFRDYAGIAKKYYNYKPYVVDLRYPTRSNGYNLLHLVNKYTDLYKSTGNISYQARAERYAKIIARTLIKTKGFEGGGQNAYFYDAAEGLIASISLLLSELCPNEERHIVSVFKLVQQLVQIDPNTIPKNKESVQKPKTYLDELMEILPDNHKAKWLAGAAISTAGQSKLSVVGTAMSKLLGFIDSELEQVICFESLDTEMFCKEKTAVFIVLPESDKPKYFLVPLFIRQIYNECIEVADSTDNNRLDKRVMFYLDEYGTMPAFDDAEQMFSAGRSRNLLQCPMIQSFSQLNKNYSRDGADIIKECCQNIAFGYLAPLSKTAEELSKSMGNETVMSGSISRNRGKTTSSSTSYNMGGKPLMSADEITHMEQEENTHNWLFNKTGFHPMKIKIVRYDNLGIKLDTPYKIEENAAHTVHYADRTTFMAAAAKKYQSSRDTYYTDHNTTNKDFKTLSDDFL